ncbi:shikimate dehydrogenase [Sporosarcina highlanderae]|uniref:Shikimate dehydrogenase (NADP(+)) n=1 Tax=Sporosarcina highlanderae TaxID=3035916 RepID=A0ABT8JPU9_9BACL|nr:shikimate dehydrogenase [Sporosarcina highlanderae]MDN4607084.1 shikimate dehydrogenase [Sporosarcina highlanderae]
MKKWYAVIGDPIAQSMSPEMHDAWFRENGINASYIPVHVKVDQLKEAVESLKKLGCSGWNVTVPHKTAIIPFIDKLDETARRMNAVNTVKVLEDGTLYGMNTDGQGFVRSLQEVYDCGETIGNVLVIGAGGAASGISFALEDAGFGPITFTNRTFEKAHRLSSGFSRSSALSFKDAESLLDKFGLIVQTTSVGMNFAQSGIPLDPSGISDGTIVTDIIYNPLETDFLRIARIAGGRTLNGIGMFVHQGALAFELWTGITPDTKKMIQSISTKLGGN